MTVVSLIRAVVFTVLGIGLVSGCGDKPNADSESTITANGTAADLVELTTFSNPKNAQGELVYVPVYSSVFHQTAGREYLLTATLSIHNIDITESIEITAVSYFDTEGRVVGNYLKDPVVLKPLSTRQFVVPQDDRSGGTGANFLVKWESAADITKPTIEAVMISTSGQQGISFITHGAVVRELQ